MLGATSNRARLLSATTGRSCRRPTGPICQMLTSSSSIRSGVDSSCFSSPERYVNHSDGPNTEQDLGVPGDQAVKFIERGEAITTNANLEIKNELESLIEVYWQAINKGDFREAARLTSPAAEFDFETSKHVGAESIGAGLAAFCGPDLGTSAAKSKARWLSMSYTAAVCVQARGDLEPIEVTTGLNREGGRWQIARQRITRLLGGAIISTGLARWSGVV